MTIKTSYNNNQKSIKFMSEISENTTLVDRYFLQCFKKLDGQLKSQLQYYLIRLIGVVIVYTLNIYYLNQTNEDTKDAFTIFLQIILAQNIIESLRLLNFYFKQVKNKQKIIHIAHQVNHCLDLDQLRIMMSGEISEQLLFFDIDPQTGLRVSSLFYDFQNKQKVTDVAQEYRTIRQNLGHNSIKVLLQTNLFCYRLCGYMLDLFSAAILIYGVVLCIRVPITQNQNTLLQIYLFLQIIYKPKVFTILLIMTLTPVVLVFGVIYLCFCRKSTKANLPKATNMTTHMLSRCSDCAICFQSFMEKQTVIQLPCSNLHIFHETCISGWTKVKPNCPICRHNLV